MGFRKLWLCLWAVGQNHQHKNGNKGPWKGWIALGECIEQNKKPNKTNKQTNRQKPRSFIIFYSFPDMTIILSVKKNQGKTSEKQGKKEFVTTKIYYGLVEP